MRGDMNFLRTNPRRCPAAVERFYREVLTIDSLIEQLTAGQAGRGIAKFLDGSRDAAGILCSRFGLTMKRQPEAVGAELGQREQLQEAVL